MVKNKKLGSSNTARLNERKICICLIRMKAVDKKYVETNRVFAKSWVWMEKCLKNEAEKKTSGLCRSIHWFYGGFMKKFIYTSSSLSLAVSRRWKSTRVFPRPRRTRARRELLPRPLRPRWPCRQNLTTATETRIAKRMQAPPTTATIVWLPMEWTGGGGERERERERDCSA